MIEERTKTDEPDVADADAIRAHVARLLASDAFRSAPQLSSFLSFIVEAALDGRRSELKGYNIAVQAFGRPAEFDPQLDPIVRVEAGRLRRSLASYYAGEGAAEPIRISIPVGGYAPVFKMQRRQPVEVPALPVQGAAPPRARSRAWPLLLVGCLGLLLTAFWQVPRPGDGVSLMTDPVSLEVQDAAAAERPRRTSAPNLQLPVLAVRVPDDTGDAPLDDGFRVFLRGLIDTLARFDDVVTVRLSGNDGSPLSGVDYLFEVSGFRLGDVAEGFGRLTSVSDGRVIWSTSGMRPIKPVGEDIELRELTRRIAVRLVEPFGIIHADLRARPPSPEIGCLFRAMSVRHTAKPEENLEARSCLEQLVEKNPDFHPAWSQLAFLSVDDFVAGGVTRAAALDRAMQAALTAVRLAPSSARAQQALMDVLFARGEVESGLRAGQLALTRNPYNPDLMADVGSRLVQLDRAAEGLPLLQKAVAISTGRPSWFDAYLFIATRLTGGQQGEAPTAFFTVDDAPMSLVARAMADAKQGDGEPARGLTERLGLPDELQALLGRIGFVASAIERIQHAIAAPETEAAASK